MPSRIERKLTTILAADAVGYSKAMEADEEAALAELRAAQAIFAQSIERHRGRVFSTAGDALLAEFPSVIEAVRCAIEVQRSLAGREAAPGATLFRIGVHLGDVIVDGENLFGDGVNLAARLESMAEPGGVLVSQPVHDQVHGRLAVDFDYLGERRPKNLERDVPVYRVVLDGRKHSSWHPSPPRRAPDAAPHAGWLGRRAWLACVIWLGLLAIDLLTGPGFWAHWPGIALLTVVGLDAAPAMARGAFTALDARLCVILGGLLLVNLASWAGTFWVVWPALAFTLIRFAARMPR